MNHADLKSRRAAPLASPTNLARDVKRDISAALNLLVADVFALYLKTKNFHSHVSGPHFRGCGAVADRCLTGNDDVVRKPSGIARLPVDTGHSAEIDAQSIRSAEEIEKESGADGVLIAGATSARRLNWCLLLHAVSHRRRGRRAPRRPAHSSLRAQFAINAVPPLGSSPAQPGNPSWLSVQLARRGAALRFANQQCAFSTLLPGHNRDTNECSIG